MKKSINILLIPVLFFAMLACENQDVNEAEQFKPREIHEDIVFHFDTIIVDGVEYMILEKDNNNPHEGFGFMAMRGNKMLEKQDTVLAYLRTITELQVQILAGITKRPSDEINEEVKAILKKYVDEQRPELLNLERTTFQNETDSALSKRR